MKDVIILVVFFVVLILSAWLTLAIVNVYAHEIPKNDISVVCVEGYKYIIVKDDTGVAITQVYSDSLSGFYSPQPQRCK